MARRGPGRREPPDPGKRQDRDTKSRWRSANALGEEAIACVATAKRRGGSASALWNLSDLLSATDPDRSDDLLVQALEAGLPDGSQRVLDRAIAPAPGLGAESLTHLQPAPAPLRVRRPCSTPGTSHDGRCILARRCGPEIRMLPRSVMLGLNRHSAPSSGIVRIIDQSIFWPMLPRRRTHRCRIRMPLTMNASAKNGCSSRGGIVIVAPAQRS